ncbi:MAG TPA: hypothetical protein DEO70_12120 [Bacteroidales bacterium]|nr:MAG: hypothetical protein A2X11_10110 [Bacteroidetes bacterium GWE2_42_24]OFY25866.1 MAG: hypothetical protein A2X09_09485 [Bacteroidetes bacterium GWF2_43_11]HBZ67574.1 hypothetical protein [Bacteroidales bacterium]
MRKRVHFFAATILISLLTSCGGVEQKEYDALKTENENLKREIEELQFGPERLLNKAKVYIDNKDFEKAKAELQTLLDKHLGSQQANDAKKLLIIVENGIKDQILAEEKAIAEKERVEKERIANATKKLHKKYDDVNEITWYRDKSSPAFVNYNGFYVYIGQTNGSKPWLRLAIQYASDDWLFIESYIIKVDGKTFTISEDSYGEIKTDNGSGGIWEWLDRKVGSSEYEIIKAVSQGKEVKIRFSGKDYHKDKTITEQQKTALRNVLDAYEALGGDTTF